MPCPNPGQYGVLRRQQKKGVKKLGGGGGRQEQKKKKSGCRSNNHVHYVHRAPQMVRLALGVGSSNMV